MTHPIEDLPPSAKLVYKILDYEGGLTAKRIARETYLPRDTTNEALRRLRDEGLVESEPDPQDPRRLIYRVGGGETPPNGKPLIPPAKNLRPSAKLIHTVLAYEGELSRQDILDRTSLPEGTVDRELQELEAAGHIISGTDPERPTAHLYKLNETSDEVENRQNSSDAKVL